jgi:dethiobiotin synthetase
MRGWFVTGTGTGVGKTVVAAALVAALRERGSEVIVRKPVVTGLEDPLDPDWPPDHELLASVAGCRPDEVAPITFGPPVSPHLAAELAGRPIDAGAIADEIRHAGAAAATSGGGRSVLVVEGVGGLLVPIADGCTVRDLAVSLGLPLVIAANPWLGTINHTLLTLEAARSAGLRVASVVLTPWPERPDAIARSNRDTIARLGTVQVDVLPRIERAKPELLAAAGGQLGFDGWR